MHARDASLIRGLARADEANKERTMRVKQTGLGLGVLMMMMSVAGSAFAYSSPWGAAAVEVRVGQELGTNIAGSDQYILWKRKSDGACSTTVIGGSGGLSNHTTVEGNSGGDTIIAQGIIENIVCSGTTFTLGPVIGNFKELRLIGLGGNDVVLGANPTTHVFGDAGTDIVSIAGSLGFVFAYGGPDGDDVSAFGTSVTEFLIGDGGNDCLWDQNADAWSFDCGAGASDQYYVNTFLTPATACDVPVTCCAWPHFAGAC
jgi:hypothetical protein